MTNDNDKPEDDEKVINGPWGQNAEQQRGGINWHELAGLTKLPDTLEGLSESPFINRVGTFYCTDLVVNSPQMALILAVMQFTPYEVKFLYGRGLFKFTGYCPHFDAKESLYAPNPTYRLTMHSEPGVSFQVKIKREAGIAID